MFARNIVKQETLNIIKSKNSFTHDFLTLVSNKQITNASKFSAHTNAFLPDFLNFLSTIHTNTVFPSNINEN